MQDTLGKIAIVGMSGRYPGSRNLAKFWRNLIDGVESISILSDEDLIRAGVEPVHLADANYVKAQGKYEGTFLFDAPFFGYTPREAEIIDPQQRAFLECCWEALEDAAYDPFAFPGRIGLLGGVGTSEYMIDLVRDQNIMQTVGQMAVLTSNEKDYLATRVAYKLNLRGPCVTIQSACSTSLAAVVLGCQNLLCHQSDIILAGGVTLTTQETTGYYYTEGGIMSPDGHCRSFDASSKGTIFTFGSGVVVLKRLEDAIADRDNIRAIILGTGLNNDGAAKVGFTAPGKDGQVDVCHEAIATANVNPETISYVECHGTGTALGDPIEVGALTQAFRAYTERRQFCAVGSVKSNVGHTDAAAGVCGLTKTVLCLEKKMIPSSLHYEKANPEIDFENSPFFVNTKLRSWKNGSGPLRAGVSSFGVGGTNAHVILEEAPRFEPTVVARPYQLITLSAKTRTALEAQTKQLGTYLAENTHLSLADVSHTVQVGRKMFPERRAFVCRDTQQALRMIQSDGKGFHDDSATEGVKVVFMFPGQGSQYVNMGRELYEEEPAFREEIDRCGEIIRNRMGLDVISIIHSDDRDVSCAEKRLEQTQFTQLALFIVEYALAKLLLTYGIQPQSMIGHSLGEYVAATLAGVFSLEDALVIVAQRGRLMQGLPVGAMLGVMLSESEARSYLGNYPALCIAGVNSPSTCVVSGPLTEVERFERQMEAKGLASRRLHTSHAFHSRMMEPILDDFAKVLAAARRRQPTLPFLSNLTGTWITAEEATNPQYWLRHLRNTVRFSDGARELLASANNAVLLEVGPGRVLSSLVAQQSAKTGAHSILTTLPHPTADSKPAMEYLWNTLGRLWAKGVPLTWTGLRGNELPRRISLPTYPFDYQEYRVKVSDPLPVELPRELTKKSDIANWFYYPSWKRSLYRPQQLRSTRGSWLLFMDSCGLASRLLKALESSGEDVITVSPGRAFAKRDAASFVIRAGEKEDYVSLMTELHVSAKEPRQIVHLWAVTSPDEERPELEMFRDTLDSCFYSLLFLAQSLSAEYSALPIRIYTISNNLYDITGEKVLNPTKATLTGPCKTIPKEYLNIKTRMFDIKLSDDISEQKLLAGNLLADLSSESAEELVAYRGGHRWIPHYEQMQVEVEEGTSPNVREGGVYLITGGLGGFGTTLSEQLASRRAKLVLLNRSPFPSRDKWDSWLKAHGTDDKVSRKILKLQRIEELGGELDIVSGDVCDLRQMEEIVASVKDRHGTINGVIHAAGTAGAGIIETKTREMADKVLLAKIQGTLVLESVLKDTQLDLFVLCSSQTSLVGYGGQVDYGSANAFLDAFAYSRKRTGDESVVSLNWDRWEEIGMAVEEPGSSPSVEGAAEFESIDHAILAGRRREGNRYIYSGVLSSNDHWLVKEHRLMGAPTMVGTGFLELARAAYQLHTGYSQVEMRNVTFISPLTMGEREERMVRIIVEDESSGVTFTIQSKPANLSWQDHANGKLVRTTRSPVRRDLQSLLDRATVTQLADNHSTPRKLNESSIELVQFGPRWEVITAVASNSNEAVATLELPQQFVQDLQEFSLHPAMFDMATAYAIDLAANGATYLPFSYDKVFIYGALPPKCYSYARYQKAKSREEEVLSFDIVVLDESGQECVIVENYNMKRVHESLVQAVAAGRTFDAGSFDSGEGGASKRSTKKTGIEYILPREGAEAFRRALSLTWMPMIVISPLAFDGVAIDEGPGSSNGAELGDETGGSNSGSHPRPNLATTYEAPRNELEKAVVDIWSRVFGIAPIGVNDNFLELGGHSLMAIQIASRMRETFEIELAVANFYKAPTPAGLAETVLQAIVQQTDSATLNEALSAIDGSELGARTAS
jgi:acyl transferase domain-containing protein